MAPRPIKIRMTEAKVNMVALRRVPRAFYLSAGDFAEFIATGPPTINALFRSKPRPEPGFDLVPVREAKTGGGAARPAGSRLFCNRGTMVNVPRL